MTQPDLKLKNRVEELRKHYASDPKHETLNILVYGNIGTGKTRLIATGRRPILIDQFDPRGTESIRKEIAEGWVIVNDFSGQEVWKLGQSIYERWAREFFANKNAGLFDYIGTYAIDSADPWTRALMNYIALSQTGRGKKREAFDGIISPAIQDYGIRDNKIQDVMREIMSLPCDFVLTGHTSTEVDDNGRIQAHKLAVTGNKVKIALPALFSEMYVAKKASIADTEYKLLTQNEGLLEAKTRHGDVLDKYEKQDLKHLRRKMGYTDADIAMPDEVRELFMRKEVIR